MNKTWHIFTILALMLIGLGAAAPQADAVTVKATLISASNGGGATDKAIAGYAGNLKRLFPYDTFKKVGAGTTQVDVPGAGAIAVSGHQIKFNTAAAEKDRIRLEVEWKQGKRELIRTAVVASRKAPTALGGPKEGDGKLILVLEYE